MSKYIKFRCHDCGDLHDTYSDAEYCCPPPPPKQVFACPECQDYYDDERSAAECCGVSEGELHAPTHAELEAAGQMRLIP